jgi:hypothetical protein
VRVRARRAACVEDARWCGERAATSLRGADVVERRMAASAALWTREAKVPGDASRAAPRHAHQIRGTEGPLRAALLTQQVRPPSSCVAAAELHTARLSCHPAAASTSPSMPRCPGALRLAVARPARRHSRSAACTRCAVPPSRSGGTPRARGARLRICQAVQVRAARTWPPSCSADLSCPSPPSR